MVENSCMQCNAKIVLQIAKDARVKFVETYRCSDAMTSGLVGLYGYYG